MTRYDSRDDTEARVAWLEREARAIRDLVEARRSLAAQERGGGDADDADGQPGRGGLRLMTGGKAADREGKGA